MKLLEHEITIGNKTDRIELFLFGDTHIGKRNCCEEGLRKQILEVLRRSKMPNRKVRVLFGGDICDHVRPGDLKRFNSHVLADWVYKGTPDEIRNRLSNISTHQLRRARDIFSPLKDITIGCIEGNHEYSMLHYNNDDVHERFCSMMSAEDLTDEALIRFKFRYAKGDRSRNVTLYIQHGKGGGRSPGAEPTHLTRLLNDWESADIVLRGDSHTFHVLPPKAVQFIPDGSLPEEPYVKHRWAANWGCWCLSHKTGKSTYESRACYPTRPMMTIKVVIWPMYRIRTNGKDITVPKIEIRSYPIL